MAIYRATPQETREFYGQGLIIFKQPSQSFLEQYKEREHWELKQAEEQEQKGGKNDSDS